MISSFLLTLREGVEAALVIGIVLSILRKVNRNDLSPAVFAGAAVAVGVSALLAVGLRLIGASLQSPAEEIFEGFSMLLAAGILTWMIFWMQRQSRQLRHEIENQVKTSLQLGARPLFWLAFFAVFREGVELAIFLLAAGLATNPGQSLIGALAGLTVALVAGWLLFQSTRRLPIRPFFQLTNVLLLLFAAGLFAHGIHEFNEVGWIPAVIAPIYDLSPVLPEDSILGSLLKAMFGYNANPSLTETLAYLTYLLSLGFFVLGSAFRPRPVPSQAD